MVIIKQPLWENQTQKVWTNFGLEADDKPVPLPGKEDKPMCKFILVNFTC